MRNPFRQPKVEGVLYDIMKVLGFQEREKSGQYVDPTILDVDPIVLTAAVTFAKDVFESDQI